MRKVCPHCRTEYGPDTLVCPNDGAPLDNGPEATDALVGQLLAERYRVIRTLGEGGMGRVYLTEHVRMGRMCAVKVMSPALAPTADAIGRFNREAANASRINHPNVAAIYDFGETAGGTLYLAMEFVDGETLAQRIRKVGSLPMALVADFTRQVADALNAAHQLGIIHRDLKPDNILLTRDPEGRELVKVVDFGIAKTMRGGGQTVTTTGVSVGTPEFMSPEQLAGDVLDARSDLYSLGLVTFTMLAGESPYPGAATKQSLVRRLTERPPTLAEIRPHTAWPLRLQAALDRAMSPEPNDRHQKVGDFATDVIAAVGVSNASDDQPTRPIPTPLVERHRPVPVVPDGTGRRTPGVLIATGIIVAVAAGGLVVSRMNSTSARTDTGSQRVLAANTTARPGPSATRTAAPNASHAPPHSPATGLIRKQPASQPAVDINAAKRVTDSIAAVLATSHRTRDSIALATARATLAVTSSLVPTRRPDSAMAAPPVAPPLTAPPRLGRHAWLNANGDSATQPFDATSPLVAEAREVIGHIARARKLTESRQVNRAGPELRTAFEEFFVFAAAHPGARETTVLRQQLMTASRAALAACGDSSDTSSVRTRRGSMCADLDKAIAAISQGAGAQPGGPAARVFQGGRRGGRPLISPSD